MLELTDAGGGQREGELVILPGVLLTSFRLQLPIPTL